MQFYGILLALVASVSAAPANDIFKRAPATCGSVSYTSAQTNAASVAACNYVRNGGTAGGSTYPHTYRNDEGFSFGGRPGPYYEFPIMSNGRVYTGGEYPYYLYDSEKDLLTLHRLARPGPCHHHLVVRPGWHHHPHGRQRQRLRGLPGYLLTRWSHRQ
jgi:hypothetical protein